MSLKFGDTVDVYRNLRTKNFSIRKDGIVEHRADSILLFKPTFMVSKKGRERVLNDKRKNVHAIVRGNYIGCDINLPFNLMSKGHYDPYIYETFIGEEGQPLLTASVAFFNGKNLYYT